MNAFRRDLPNPLLRREYVLDFCVIMRDSRRNDFNLTMSAGVVAHGEGNGNLPHNLRADSDQICPPVRTRIHVNGGSGAISKGVAKFGGLGIIIAEWGSGAPRVKVRYPNSVIKRKIDSSS